jgi:ABC-type antimicrobial peptide transport system permease subunit
MRDACVAAGVGAGMGLIAVVGVSDVVSSLLYGVSPTDWTTLASTTLALIGLAAAAAIVPARRAGRVSPTIALREE